MGTLVDQQDRKPGQRECDDKPAAGEGLDDQDQDVVDRRELPGPLG